jgi:hypothetical protein
VKYYLLKYQATEPVIFKHKRIGYKGRPFMVRKFTTIFHSAPRGIVVLNRVRRLGWDEIPQWRNIIKGEMSIWGPRPLTQKTFELGKADKAFYLDLMKKRRPGLASLYINYQGPGTDNGIKIESARQHQVAHRHKLHQFELEHWGFGLAFKEILFKRTALPELRRLGEFIGLLSPKKKAGQGFRWTENLDEIMSCCAVDSVYVINNDFREGTKEKIAKWLMFLGLEFKVDMRSGKVWTNLALWLTILNGMKGTKFSRLTGEKTGFIAAIGHEPQKALLITPTEGGYHVEVINREYIAYNKIPVTLKEIIRVVGTKSLLGAKGNEDERYAGAPAMIKSYPLSPLPRGQFEKTLNIATEIFGRDDKTLKPVTREVCRLASRIGLPQFKQEMDTALKDASPQTQAAVIGSTIKALVKKICSMDMPRGADVRRYMRDDPGAQCLFFEGSPHLYAAFKGEPGSRSSQCVQFTTLLMMLMPMLGLKVYGAMNQSHTWALVKLPGQDKYLKINYWRISEVDPKEYRRGEDGNFQRWRHKGTPSKNFDFYSTRDKFSKALREQIRIWVEKCGVWNEGRRRTYKRIENQYEKNTKRLWRQLEMRFFRWLDHRRLDAFLDYFDREEYCHLTGIYIAPGISMKILTRWLDHNYDDPQIAAGISETGETLDIKPAVSQMGSIPFSTPGALMMPWVERLGSGLGLNERQTSLGIAPVIESPFFAVLGPLMPWLHKNTGYRFRQFWSSLAIFAAHWSLFRLVLWADGHWWPALIFALLGNAVVHFIENFGEWN